jgi:hypothetical protein
VSALGNDSSVHFIRDGRFVCTAVPTARCRNYPDCECEAWGGELHGDSPAEGHADQPQDECWIKSWMEAVDLSESYADGDGDVFLDDSEFPDGPVSVEWEFDYLTWHYADDTNPRKEAAA